jgi:hypothetical protein
MTEKQMGKLADIVAAKVINKLVAKQKEWDEEFNKQMNDPDYFEGVVPKLTKKAKMELEMADLIKVKSTYILTERYELIEDIENRIEDLQKRLNDL